MADKVIITCAVTGAIHTPSMSPYLPVTPEEIADAAIGAAEAGARRVAAGALPGGQRAGGVEAVHDRHVAVHQHQVEGQPRVRPVAVAVALLPGVFASLTLLTR